MATIGDFSLFRTGGGDEVQVGQDWVTILLSVSISFTGAWRFISIIFPDHKWCLSVNSKLIVVASMFIYGFCSVWSLHFCAMNAVKFPGDVHVYYNIWLTMLSCIFPLAGAARAVMVLNCHTKGLGRRTTCISASLSMTGGIALMHYTGMMSMVGVHQNHSIWSVLITAFFCVVVNYLAVSLLLVLPEKQSFKIFWKLACTIAISAGVTIPHFFSQFTTGFTRTLWAPKGPFEMDTGRDSDMQLLVFTVNFVFGTLLANMVQSARTVEQMASKAAKYLSGATPSAAPAAEAAATGCELRLEEAEEELRQ